MISTTFDPDRREVRCSITMHCSAQRVFEVWQDVSNWHAWDPDTKQAELAGPFAVGSSGRLVPAKGQGVTMVVTQVTPGQSFTVQAKVLGTRMIFPHTVMPLLDGVQVTHAVRFEGWLAGVFMRTVGRQVEKGLPVTLARLKARCEAGAN
jgi:Polyketide cyclase / dehydrase and lipid transport